MNIRSLLHMVVMIGYSTAVHPDARNEYQEPFCLRTKSAFGHTHCSFLRKSAAIAPLLFYWTIWTADKYIEKCSISADPDLIENYLSLCPEMRTWNLKDTQSLNLNISQLFGRNSPCEFIPNTLRHFRRNFDMDWVRSGGKIRQKRAWILPGTFWCGHGSSAGDYEQLGMFEPVDRCCREHDHCSHIIQPFTLNFGVFNPTLFTISHCSCDHRCTSVKVAPFAMLKYSTPYNSVSSSQENIVITDHPVYQAKPSIKGKQINIKPKQRKQLEPQERYDQLAHLREDAFWLKQQYGTSKTPLTRTTTLPSVYATTHLNSLTTHNSKLVHKKKQTVNQRTSSIKKSELCPTISSLVHTRASQGCYDQKPFHTQFPKKKSTNRRKMTTSQNHTTTNQPEMIQRSKPLKAMLNCFSIGPPRGDNLKRKQKRGKYCKVDNASKKKNFNATLSMAKIKRKKSKGQMAKRKNLKQKVNLNHSLNISTFAEIKQKLSRISKVSKTRKLSSAKRMSPTKPRNALWRNTTPHPKTNAVSLTQASLFLKTTARFNSSSTNQESISSVLKNTIIKKRCSSKRNLSAMKTTSKKNTSSESAASVHISISVLKQNMVSATEVTKTLNSSLWNISNSTSDDFKPTESPKICDVARYLDGCKYRIHPMEKIYGHYNTELMTIYHCDCIHKLTSHLKQLKNANILELIFAKFVSQSCIEISNISECNKHTGCPALLSKVTELDSRSANNEDHFTAKDEKEPTTKRTSDQIYKHCLKILNGRNSHHVGNGPS
ncbi:uncharacterized protein LOC143487892 isoform X2 [Brachyhypopomus gauderio]|uniref:uncharacterized protein LOC143487892 isoform X2 n=1 Tax=Brachyhypopomus gauderio TaxID=698409 RepID=UPI0040415805